MKKLLFWLRITILDFFYTRVEKLVDEDETRQAESLLLAAEFYHLVQPGDILTLRAEFGLEDRPGALPA